jgi:hypothetical protein
MTTGILLFCFDTDTCEYSRIANRCISLIQKNLDLPITVVTNNNTKEKLQHRDISLKIFKNETGNLRGKKQWNNLDRCHAYDLSPYQNTILMDIDYLPYTNNLLEYIKVSEDFLIHDKIHDLTGKGVYDFRKRSIIPMLWATVIIFRKTARARNIFDMVKYVKKHYQYFCDLYKIDMRNFRNDYAFTIALNQINGNMQQSFLPGNLPTLPEVAKVQKITDEGVIFKYDDKIGYIRDQDVHVIDKELYNV